MRNTIKVLVVLFFIGFVFISFKEKYQQNEKISLTKDQIMTIYEGGYLRGMINGYNGKNKLKDSIYMVDLIEKLK